LKNGPGMHEYRFLCPVFRAESIILSLKIPSGKQNESTS